jgi:anti-sigma B factor antagonist
MKMEVSNDTVRITGINELGAANSGAFRDWVRSSIRNGQRNIEVDLSQTTFIDSCGLGALIALHKTACSREGTLRLLNPQPSVQQVLQLTRMHRLFEIVRTTPAGTDAPDHVPTEAVAAAA